MSQLQSLFNCQRCCREHAQVNEEARVNSSCQQKLVELHKHVCNNAIAWQTYRSCCQASMMLAWYCLMTRMQAFTSSGQKSWHYCTQPQGASAQQLMVPCQKLLDWKTGAQCFAATAAGLCPMHINKTHRNRFQTNIPMLLNQHTAKNAL